MKSFALCLAVCLAASAAQAAVIQVTNTNDSGPGSLRNAFVEAYSSLEDHSIVINLPANSVIAPLSELPQIISLNDVHSIQLLSLNRVYISGANLEGSARGLRISGQGHLVENIGIIEFPSHGISINGDNIQISNCHIGTDGVSARPNGGHGILVQGGEYITIGATEQGFLGNVISGNAQDGVHSSSTTVFQLRIFGNKIGTNAAGTAAVPNDGDGLNLKGGGLLVGATFAGSGNLISGNTGAGIRRNDGGFQTGNNIVGNVIGLNATGTAAIPNLDGVVFTTNSHDTNLGMQFNPVRNHISGNTRYGVVIEGGPHNVWGNRIGVGTDDTTPIGNGSHGVLILSSGARVGDSTTANASNLIAHNGGHGVRVDFGNFNAVVRNSIFLNALGGISLAPGTNQDAQPPLITGVNPITGMAAPGSTLSFYADAGAQGRHYIGSLSLSTESDGAFSVNYDLSPFPGLNLTATMTIVGSNTSQFSPPFALPGGPPPGTHAADQNGDNAIGISELLRVIQFFNSPAYHCQEGTEDGFAPGNGPQACAPHSSDYNPPDWRIVLTELLRLIQFYNSGAYHACGSGEDGFCPGPEK